jgi:hypothetical protein
MRLTLRTIVLLLLVGGVGEAGPKNGKPWDSDLENVKQRVLAAFAKLQHGSCTEKCNRYLAEQAAAPSFKVYDNVEGSRQTYNPRTYLANPDPEWIPGWDQLSADSSHGDAMNTFAVMAYARIHKTWLARCTADYDALEPELLAFDQALLADIAKAKTDADPVARITKLLELRTSRASSPLLFRAVGARVELEVAIADACRESKLEWVCAQRHPPAPDEQVMIRRRGTRDLERRYYCSRAMDKGTSRTPPLYSPQLRGDIELVPWRIERVKPVFSREQLQRIDQDTMALRDADLVALWARKDVPVATVSAHFPELQPASSLDLATVGATFARAKPGMIFTLKAGYHAYAPATVHEAREPDQVPANNRYGFVARLSFRGTEYFIGVSVRIAGLESGTPVLIWDRVGNDKVIVTAPDGGRYEVPLTDLEPGSQPATSWPKPLRDVYLDEQDLPQLEAAGQVPAGTAKRLEGLSTSAGACGTKIFAAADPQFKAIEVANITQRTRENRANALEDRLNASIQKRCAGAVVKYKTELEKVIDARNKKRLEAYRASQTGAP